MTVLHPYVFFLLLEEKRQLPIQFFFGLTVFYLKKLVVPLCFSFLTTKKQQFYPLCFLRITKKYDSVTPFVFLHNDKLQQCHPF